MYSTKDNINLPDCFLAGLSDTCAGPTEFLKDTNPFGFSIRVTANGSMTQDIFFDFCAKFVRHLPDGHGKGGLPHILLLDGHASRWNLAALEFLNENNVYPFFLQSHTSVWTQPNDNGANLRFHTCVEEAIKRFQNTGMKNTVWFYNSVIQWAWQEFLRREREELVNAGENSTTSAWRVCGFYPFNPNPDAWKQLSGSLGLQNDHLNKKRKESEHREYDVHPREAGCKELTNHEKSVLLNGMSSGTSVEEAAYFHL